jgi:hypothetical protein
LALKNQLRLVPSVMVALGASGDVFLHVHYKLRPLLFRSIIESVINCTLVIRLITSGAISRKISLTGTHWTSQLGSRYNHGEFVTPAKLNH